MSPKFLKFLKRSLSTHFKLGGKANGRKVKPVTGETEPIFYRPVDFVDMLEQFWTSHPKDLKNVENSPLNRSSGFRRSKKDSRNCNQVIVYESTFVQGGYTTFVTLPSGECFANPQRCRSVHNSRQHAARVALVHCMFGGAPATYSENTTSSKSRDQDDVRCKLCGCDCKKGKANVKRKKSVNQQKNWIECEKKLQTCGGFDRSNLLDSTLEEIMQQQSVCNIKCDMEKSYDTVSYVLNNSNHTSNSTSTSSSCNCCSSNTYNIYSSATSAKSTCSTSKSSSSSIKSSNRVYSPESRKSFGKEEESMDESSWSETVLKLHLMHWNGSLSRLANMRYTKQQVARELSYLSVAQLTQLMISEWAVRERKEPGLISLELTKCQRQLLSAIATQKNVRIPKEKCLVLLTALDQVKRR